MNRKYAAVFALITGLVLVSAVYAHFPGDEKSGSYEDLDIGAVTKFQRETLHLRDQLLIKKMEVHREYRKENPDYEKIGTLKKEMVDIRTKIAIKADESGLPEWIGRGKGRNFAKSGREGGRYHCPGEW